MSIPTYSHYIGRDAKATASLLHLVMWRTENAGSEVGNSVFARSTCVTTSTRRTYAASSRSANCQFPADYAAIRPEAEPPNLPNMFGRFRSYGPLEVIGEMIAENRPTPPSALKRRSHGRVPYIHEASGHSASIKRMSPQDGD
jgi:hypothetical protein